MSDTPSVLPNDFEPAEFGRVIVTRMLTDTSESWAEIADIGFYEKKGDAILQLAGLAVDLIGLLATASGITPLEWWRRALAEDAANRGGQA